ncbi:MAG TPA: hypothetical protein VHE37_13835 [Nevskiaceae bacterium]|nr:hypothetical protein [Nevskiaceae bacterium]
MPSDDASGARLPAVDCAQLMDEIAVSLRPRALERRLQLEVICPPSCMLAIDAAVLRQLLLELLGVAIDLAHAGSVIFVLRPGVGGITDFVISNTTAGGEPPVQQALQTTLQRARSMAAAIGGRIVHKHDAGGASIFMLILGA